MSFEKPTGEQSKKRYKEFNGEKFEIDEVDVLKPGDITPGDRIMITTESGNRYMIRWSKSANAPKIYSERTKFNDGYELYNKYGDGGTIAEVGKSFEFSMITDKEKNIVQPFNATNVAAIEIRRGIDTAIENSPREISGSGIADMLINRFRAKSKTDNDG